MAKSEHRSLSGVLLVGAALLAFVQPLRANLVTFHCGAPTVNGSVDVHYEQIVPFIGPQTGTITVDNISAGSAESKCVAIAAKLSGVGFSAIAVGTTVLIDSTSGNFLEQITLVDDNTQEGFTALSANLAPGQLVRIVEVLADPTGVPPGGFYSGLFINTPTIGTFGTTANGTDNGATVVDALDNNFTAHFGIPFGPQVPFGTENIARISDKFDPTTVEIGWDGNTALHLANFGLEFEPPVPAPEPATLALLSIGFAGLGLSRRKRKQ